MLTKNIFLFFFCNFLIAGNIDRMPTKTEVKGIDAKYVTKASNGNVYIRNARIDTNRVDNNQILIKTGSNVRKVIISNVKVNARNTSTISENATNAILGIKASKNTEILIKNVDMNSHNVKVVAKSKNNTNVCAGALCIQSENNNIKLKNLNIHSSSLSTEVYSSGTKSKCAGALCIQASDSIVDLDNIKVSNTGTNLYKVIN